ncbi:MAG TPA: DUF6000 family protein [Tepidisphaeraceae bacterium]|nr:DUF6000 family protein [Tepidisphaeraceae bacterium]
MSQREMYDLFSRYCIAHDKDTDEKSRDAILDTMDLIVGWCRPSGRLFDHSIGSSEDHLVRTFVVPFYLRVLHGNCVPMLMAAEDSRERQKLIRRMTAALRIVDTDVVDRLFADRNWRARLMAAWYCGVKGWGQYSDRIADLLIPSRQCFAGQAYCFALARFGDDKSARHLCRYLDEYLPHPELRYDQHWAMPALMWIDSVRGTEYANPYLEVNGLWEQFHPRATGGRQELAEREQRFRRLMQATTEHISIE